MPSGSAVSKEKRRYQIFPWNIDEGTGLPFAWRNRRDELVATTLDPDIAVDLNRAALSQKLEEMAQRVPPRKRQRLADLLSSDTEQLRKLHAQGWTDRQLAQELGTSGLPVSVGALREHLAGKPRKRKSGGKNAGRKAGADAAKKAP